MKIYWNSVFKHCSKDNDNFPFCIRIYDGVQGSGKSLSMCFDALQLLDQFPDLRLISNMIINDDRINYDYLFDSVDTLIKKIYDSENKNHVLIIIDESLTYFAENGGIDPALMNQFTQNRKNRRMVFIATQKFTRLNNRLRDFSTETVKCRNWWKFQINYVRDDTTLKWDRQEMDYVGLVKYKYIFKRNDELFNKFDTYQKIKIDTKTKSGELLLPKSPPHMILAVPTK